MQQLVQHVSQQILMQQAVALVQHHPPLQGTLQQGMSHCSWQMMIAQMTCAATWLLKGTALHPALRLYMMPLSVVQSLTSQGR